MSTKSKSDISNSAIRMLLQSVGAYYDEVRGFARFSTRSPEWRKVKEFFDGSCCYCGSDLDTDNATEDHLIPINKTSLGLHAWGNLVPCCRHCNGEKHFKDWGGFVASKCNSAAQRSGRVARIRGFQRKWKYNPSLRLQEIAQNLYEDVGEISSTLISLRLKQAQAVIKRSLRKS